MNRLLLSFFSVTNHYEGIGCPAFVLRQLLKVSRILSCKLQSIARISYLTLICLFTALLIRGSRLHLLQGPPQQHHGGLRQGTAGDP